MPKTNDTLVDSHVSLKQCKLAIEALEAHTSKKEAKAADTELLPGKEQFLWLQIAVKKTQAEKKHKPCKIPIVHPLVDPRSSAVCLIVKDPQREYKDLLETHGIKFISRVIGITKLKGKFKPYEARRMLLKDHALFLADDRVTPLLPGLLGSKWFDAKKQPIPVCVTRKDLKGELERAISSTYMHQNQGTCTSVKIATTAQTPTQALANLEKALPKIIENLNGGWENVQSLHIKTSDSVALPIYTCGLEDENNGRWDGLVAGQDSESESETEEIAVDDEPSVSTANSTGKAKGKGAKRPSEEEAEGAEKPKKRVKSEAAVAATAPASSAESSTPRKKQKLQATSPAKSVTVPAATVELEESVDEPVTLIDTSLKKKSKKGPSKTEAPAPTASVTSPATSATKKSKKQKTQPSIADADVEAADVSVSATPAVAATVDIAQAAPSPVQKKGKKQKKAEAASAAETSVAAPADPVSTSVAATIDTSADDKKQRKKKAKVSVEESTSVPAPVVDTLPAAAASLSIGSPVDGDKKKRKRKSVGKSEADATPAIDLAPAAVEAPAAAVPAETPRKKARVSFAKILETSEPAPTFITKGELKQKRSALSGEKKKDKVVSGSGKSAKDAILGRKPGRA